MKHVRNDGNGPLLAYGHELAAGKSVEMSDAEAAQLVADPHVAVTVADEAFTDASATPKTAKRKTTTNRRK